MDTYEPLRLHLMGLPADAWRASFDEVEKVLGFTLPRSAYTDRSWWRNDTSGHRHSRAWLDAGFWVEDVDMDGRVVTFRVPQPDETGADPLDQKAQPPPELHGALAGTVHVRPGTDLTEPTSEPWSADPKRSRT